jgi:hypothetical protein
MLWPTAQTQPDRLSGDAVKFVRALLAAAVAFGAAAAVQVATSSPASAEVQAGSVCGGCWWVVEH